MISAYSKINLRVMCDKIVIHADPDLADLIPGFLENRRKDVLAITEAMARGDLERVRILGHSMKGSGGGYGFETITEVGGALEEAARIQDTEAIRHALTRLEHYLEQIQVVYE
jgi:HPt (histidine-containing phosphotransfer) domain-containing protein